MKLNPVLRKIPEVTNVIKYTGINTEMVIKAYDLFYENRQTTGDTIRNHMDRLRRVSDMCKHLKPQTKDVVAMILFEDYPLGSPCKDKFQKTFGAKEGLEYHITIYQHLCDAQKSGINPNHPQYVHNVARRIMLSVCDQMGKSLQLGHKQQDQAIVFHALKLLQETAANPNDDVCDPFSLAFSLRCAEFLLDQGADSATVAASLVVNGNHSPTELIATGTHAVASIVAATKKLLVNLDELTSSNDWNDFESETRSIPDYYPALCILAAQMIQRLHTAPLSEEQKTLIDLYITVLNRFGVSAYADLLEDEQWKNNDPDCYEQVQDAYERVFARNKDVLQECIDLLQDHAANHINRSSEETFNICNVEVHTNKLLPFAVRDLVQHEELPREALLASINEQNIPLAIIDVIFSPLDATASKRDEVLRWEQFANSFMDMFHVYIAQTDRTIIGIRQFGASLILDIQDRYRNRISLRLIMKADYERMHGLVTDRNRILASDSLSTDNPMITIFLRNGKPLQIPQGSTVIDVAYAIHLHKGNTLISASVNGQEVPLHYVLKKYQKINIVADTAVDANGALIRYVPHIERRWLNWAFTLKARKAIYAFLMEKYFGDDTQSERNAHNNDVLEAMDRILDEWNPDTAV